jgi:Zn-dependent M28 family amino/carboxypeptidase
VTGFGADVQTIPAAAIGVPEAENLERLAKTNTLRIRLKLASSVDPDSVAWNVSGDIKGSASDEVVLIGAHLDSWDVGTGALDDAVGIGITAAAAHLIGTLPRHPRRTVRIVMFGSEESGGSSESYLEAHQHELGKIVLAGESDAGAGPVYRLKMPEGAAASPLGRTAAGVLSPLKIQLANTPASDAGADLEGLESNGVPVFVLEQDVTKYFDWHHSWDDTLDKVDREELAHNVAAWTSFLYLVADSDVDFRALAASVLAAEAASPKVGVK